MLLVQANRAGEEKESSLEVDEVRLGVVLLQASDLVCIAMSNGSATGRQLRGAISRCEGRGLTMNVVVVGIVPEQVLHRVPRQSKAAVVVDRLPSRERKEQHRLARRHARTTLGQHAPEGVENESFEWVVVQRAERVSDLWRGEKEASGG